MHEVRIDFPVGHGLEAPTHTTELDTLAREALGDDCYGISVNEDCVRIHLADSIAADDEAVETAVADIQAYFEQLEG